MKTNLFRAFGAFINIVLAALMGPPLRRGITHDVAFPFRMGAGFPGDVNRAHPASIVPALINTSVQAPRAYGDAVLIDTATNSMRGVIAADGSVTAARIEGVLVRPFPSQQQTGNALNSPIGAGTPPSAGAMDYIEDGFVMVKLPAGASVTKGGAAFVWCAATAGNNIQGAFVAAASGTNTLSVTNARFNGPADAQGNAELRIFKA